MRHAFKVDGEVYQVAPKTLSGELILNIGGRDCAVALTDMGHGEYALQVDGVGYHAFLAHRGDEYFIKLDGRYFRVTAYDPRDAATAGAESDVDVRAPMPGVVVRLLVAEGDIVDAGDKLMTIESMKLQTTITAPVAGVIARLPLGEGGEFNKDTLLVEFMDGACSTSEGADHA